MGYLGRKIECRLDPGVLLPGAKSVIGVGLNYHAIRDASDADPADRWRIAMYAWGDDYHEVVREKLRAVEAGMRAAFDETFATRACVDTAPLLEREWAAEAGVGWIGKNTMVLHEQLGSYFFLGALVTTLELAPDEPATDHCGTCTACLDACPTDAFPAPYEMDASRCISYLTIEHRGDIPGGLASRMGDWIFGCDVCQQVCPWNRFAQPTDEPAFQPRPGLPAPELSELLALDEEGFRRRFQGSPIQRTKRAGLQRNARVAQVNQD